MRKNTTDFSISVGRIDSQITIAIDKNKVEDFFILDGVKNSGRERIFKSNISGSSIFTSKSWIRNNEKDVYMESCDDMKKMPQPILKKRDFVRIYDKLIEVIETTLPHSDQIDFDAG